MEPGGNDIERPRVINGPLQDENKMENEAAVRGTDGGIDGRAHNLIGQRLRKVYGDLVREPVPDHLLKLLQELEDNEGKGSAEQQKKEKWVE